MSTFYVGLLGLALVIAATWAFFLVFVATLYQLALRRERQRTRLEEANDHPAPGIVEDFKLNDRAEVAPTQHAPTNAGA